MGVSVWKLKVLKTDGDDGAQQMWLDLMSMKCTFQNGWKGKCYVYFFRYNAIACLTEYSIA